MVLWFYRLYSSEQFCQRWILYEQWEYSKCGGRVRYLLGRENRWIKLREKEIIDDVHIGDFISIDSEVKISETPNELNILNNVKKKNNTVKDWDEDEGNEDANDRDTKMNKPSHDEMLKLFVSSTCEKETWL